MGDQRLAERRVAVELSLQRQSARQPAVLEGDHRRLAHLVPVDRWADRLLQCFGSTAGLGGDPNAGLHRAAGTGPDLGCGGCGLARPHEVLTGFGHRRLHQRARSDTHQGREHRARCPLAHPSSRHRLLPLLDVVGYFGAGLVDPFAVPSQGCARASVYRLAP